MKEIKETRMIEEVVGYEAYDGTRFADRRECEKYEKLTAEEAINKAFSNLIVAMFEEDDFTQCGDSFIGSGVGEGCGIAVIKMKTEDDVNKANAFQHMHHRSAQKHFTTDMIGKEILVYISSDFYDTKQDTGTWSLDSCWIYGTVEDQVATFERRLRELIADNRWDE